MASKSVCERLGVELADLTTESNTSRVRRLLAQQMQNTGSPPKIREVLRLRQVELLLSYVAG